MALLHHRSPKCSARRLNAHFPNRNWVVESSFSSFTQNIFHLFQNNVHSYFIKQTQILTLPGVLFLSVLHSCFCPPSAPAVR